MTSKGVRITTRRGDGGESSLLFGKRVAKQHPRLMACGAVDELSAAIGLARSVAGRREVGVWLLGIQKTLVALMGELAASDEDQARYFDSSMPVLQQSDLDVLDQWVEQLERDCVLSDWSYPGANRLEAGLQWARAICRRAERELCLLRAEGAIVRDLPIMYLNRLADFLWLTAVDAAMTSV